MAKDEMVDGGPDMTRDGGQRGTIKEDARAGCMYVTFGGGWPLQQCGKPLFV